MSWELQRKAYRQEPASLQTHFGTHIRNVHVNLFVAAIRIVNEDEDNIEKGIEVDFCKVVSATGIPVKMLPRRKEERPNNDIEVALLSHASFLVEPQFIASLWLVGASFHPMFMLSALPGSRPRNVHRSAVQDRVLCHGSHDLVGAIIRDPLSSSTHSPAAVFNEPVPPHIFTVLHMYNFVPQDTIRIFRKDVKEHPGHEYQQWMVCGAICNEFSMDKSNFLSVVSRG
ncbi:hypothetical protein EDD18DRAFT_1107703 [Armillaria luteobubalina]|uniref:Uncharacterized protein n=1 Tax=Armillaria luteobubalina TaxID=153913 RepID=A0AA39Q050_9AGAR|nr:hypothetical protein EDD18DRAFT_1107703 [Armillaria luteobubalina]